MCVGGCRGWPNGYSIGLQTRRPGFDTRCHQIHSEYTLSTCSLNQWVRKSYGLNHECRGLENISRPFSSMQKIVDVEICGVTICRPFEEFRRANSYCHLYVAQGQRQAYF
ncbi:hypothetical protein TNCV_3166731 [Trichonephila clavipes]|uniref:Uncharacterized protein n=1 Tax=Trichonephila clavipes TaxID=2585209 RepID=A0A8X6V0L0_TRICX|nr:hypothetical protein TNCV_3166731 [Trichonephila clavipes]